MAVRDAEAGLAGAVLPALTAAKTLAGSLPDLLVEARRVAATVLTGWHGRRRAGPGETFWQFRPFIAGEAAGRIDWRRSARDDHLYVREREWEATHTVWLWADLSASMQFRSSLAAAPKRDRALVLLLLAMADMLSAAGERVGFPGLTDPILGRNAAERLAAGLAHADEAALTGGVPAGDRIGRFADVMLFGDFLDPLEAIEARLTAIARAGATGHLVEVRDPVEETFPFAGRTEFRDPETGFTWTVGRAERIAADYRQRLAARRERLGGLCRRFGWSYLTHRTDRPATEPLLALYARLAERPTTGGAA